VSSRLAPRQSLQAVLLAALTLGEQNVRPSPRHFRFLNSSMPRRTEIGRNSMARGHHAFLRGKLAEAYGYSAPILGPTIRVRRGDEIEVSVHNDLDRDTTVHWHGLLVPGDVDGGPTTGDPTGEDLASRSQSRPTRINRRYHPHPHHDTARQTYMDLSGLIIVGDGSDARLGLPRTYGVDDLPIILQDRASDDSGSLIYELDALTSPTGAGVIPSSHMARSHQWSRCRAAWSD
jgi:FtsP/CotA-like multicopper oxidase with cupredoxin domain